MGNSATGREQPESDNSPPVTQSARRNAKFPATHRECGEINLKRRPQAGSTKYVIKHQIPSTKFQTNAKLQIPMTKTTDRALPVLNLGAWDSGFVWDLEFGAWDFPFVWDSFRADLSAVAVSNCGFRISSFPSGEDLGYRWGRTIIIIIIVSGLPPGLHGWPEHRRGRTA
jgi:hypothetical protein